ncbi:MAG: cupredoxin domain-containing protein [Bdellovibrionales bacterium]|nr:cupredoxin domain-containing protein [Bdellovibrionales bacterium]
MKIKKGLFILIAGVAMMGQAFAMVFPDQIIGEETSENENQDAISRFGSDAKRDEKKRELSRVLQPISESSFEGSGNRSPASVIEKSLTGQPKSAVIRKLKKEKAYQEVAVIANELGFFPSTVFVTEGVAVKLFLTGASQKSQCFMLDPFEIRRQVRNQRVEEITFTPEHAGKYTFHCPMNGAKGTLVVRELDLGERKPASSSPDEGEAALDHEEIRKR